MFDLSFENLKKIALMCCIAAIFPFLIAKGFDLLVKDTKPHNEHRKKYFYTTMVCGSIAIVAGIVLKMNFVGAGFIMGGLFSLLSGLASSWSDLPNVTQFVVLLMIFLMLIVGSYFLVMRSKQS